MNARRGTWSRVDRLAAAGACLITLVMVVVLARVVQLQVAGRQSRERGVLRAGERAVRGAILDRRGRLIATTRFGYRVFVDPVRFPAPPDEAIVELAAAMGVDPGLVGDRLIRRIVRNLDADHAESERGQRASLIRYVSIGGILPGDRVRAVRSASIPGVYLERRPVRRRIQDPTLASLVGKVDADGRGLVGVEHEFESALRGADGQARFVVDASGRPLWIPHERWTAAHHGHAVTLSVDLELQRIGREELSRGMEDADAAGGRLMMVDPRTGEILAMVDLVRTIPDAAPYPWEDADAGKRGVPRVPEPLGPDRPRYRVLEADPWRGRDPALARNRCIQDVYEPGSSFKPIVWSAITAAGGAKPEERIDTEGGRWRTPYGRMIRDVTRRDQMTWAQVLVNSSNIGMVKVTSRMSHEWLREVVLRFGFGRATGLGLGGEAAGLVTSSGDWSDYTQTSVAFGGEVAVTMPQVCRAFSALARTGDLAGTLPSMRIEAVGSGWGGQRIMHRVLPPDVAELTRRTLVGVVDKLDQHLRRVDPGESSWRYRLFGKSGTPEIPVGPAPPGKRRPRGWSGYFEGQYRPNFIAAGPVDDPRLVCLVVIDDPGPEMIRQRRHYGSGTAGPIVRRVMERALAYLGIDPGPAPESGTLVRADN